MHALITILAVIVAFSVVFALGRYLKLSPALKDAGALFPLAMSLAALGIVLVHAAVFGIVHEADEGTEAHTLQLLMLAQLPIVAFFAIKWLPRTPKQAMQVLAAQGGAACAAFASVFFLT